MTYKDRDLFQLDGRLVEWNEIIRAAERQGYKLGRRLFSAAEAAAFLRMKGHTVVEPKRKNLRGSHG